jgi:hypothetical protein
MWVRVQVHAARFDPELVGKCQRREGWERCPYLKPALAVARDRARKLLDGPNEVRRIE